MELELITSGSIFDYFLNATEYLIFHLNLFTPLAPKYRLLLAVLFTLIAIYTQIVKGQTNRTEEKVQKTLAVTPTGN